jgi:hypothetical protein
MSSSQGQGGRGRREVALPVVACPPQQHPRPREPIILSPDHRTRNRPLMCSILLCCIVFWAAVTGAGFSVLIIVLAYHPKVPVLSLNAASLNAGYLDEHTVSGGPSSGLTLNADLTVLVVFYSGNTKIDVELDHMQLDLHFKGHMIGTQVFPAAAREGPGDKLLRSVHFVASEVPLPQEDAEAWRNATANGGPVVLRLAGRFRARLFIGPWLRFPLKVYPHCTLWLRPPPGGILLESRCRQ